MAERKLKAWVAAGLIDAGTADRIRAWEAEHSRPVALWAVIGLAALSIGLGVISLVAANWAAIDGETRLTLHALLLIGLGAALWSLLAQGGERAHRWAEAGIFVFAMLGLGFIGHLGQVYQTSAPTWMAIGLWLGLFAPLLLGGGRGWLSAALLGAGCIALPWMRFGDPALGFSAGPAGPGLIRGAIECSAPVFLAPLGAYACARYHNDALSRPFFWRRLEQIGFAYAVISVSLFVIGSGLGNWAGHDAAGNVDTALIAVAGMLGLAALALWRSDRSLAGSAGAAVLGMLAAAILGADRLAGHGLAVGLLFMALWAGMAGAALHAQARWAFQLAVAIVAMRLIILAFEEAGGLLASGIGLILGGLLILGVAWGAMRISRHFAPAQERA